VLARVLLAQNNPAAALTLLQRLADAAASQGRTGSIIEIQALRALAQAARGDHADALGALTEALTLARRPGYVRVFPHERPAPPPAPAPEPAPAPPRPPHRPCLPGAPARPRRPGSARPPPHPDRRRGPGPGRAADRPRAGGAAAARRRQVQPAHRARP